MIPESVTRNRNEGMRMWMTPQHFQTLNYDPRNSVESLIFMCRGNNWFLFGDISLDSSILLAAHSETGNNWPKKSTENIIYKGRERKKLSIHESGKGWNTSFRFLPSHQENSPLNCGAGRDF